MAAEGGKKCMDCVFCGYAAGRLVNGLLKRFFTVLTKTDITVLPFRQSYHLSIFYRHCLELS